MWYILQAAVIGWTAYIYLTRVSHVHDVFHALFLGVIVAWFTTAAILLLIDAARKLNRIAQVTLASRSLRLLGRRKLPERR